MRREKNKKPQTAVTLFFVVAMIFSHTLFASAAIRYDVNRDGKFNISDATTIQKYRVGLLSDDDIDSTQADANKDGEITIRDATYIQMILAGILTETNDTDEDMRIRINDIDIEVEWANNEAVTALKEMVNNNPLTINMSMYGGFEQVGSLGANLPANDTRIVTEPGDIVLYSGNQMVVFYGSNTWSYTRLGKIKNKTETQLKELLSNGNVKITLIIE